MMSVYSLILSLWNMPEVEEEKEIIIKEAVKVGYEI